MDGISREQEKPEASVIAKEQKTDNLLQILFQLETVNQHRKFVEFQQKKPKENIILAVEDYLEKEMHD
jgi:hypothetical protein